MGAVCDQLDQEVPNMLEFITHDSNRSHGTPSDGACGYAFVCFAVMHARGDISSLDPGRYFHHMHRLAIDLKKLTTSPELK